MRLAHRRRHAPAPVAVEAAKPAVAKPIRLVGAVLQPEQHQRHATALELLVEARPIQWRTLRFRLERGGREQPPFQLGVVDLLRHRPGDADHLGPANVLPDRRLPDPSDCAIERSLIPSACLNRSTSRTLRIDNLSAGIRHPLRLLQGPDHAIRSPTDSPPSRHLSGGRLQLESCPPSVGISGRFTLEYARRSLAPLKHATNQLQRSRYGRYATN